MKPTTTTRNVYGPIPNQACQTADGHIHSWVRRDGTAMCEDCARVAAGWKPCRVPIGKCPNLVPPKPNATSTVPWVPLCELHAPMYDVVGCRTCDATGWFECDDMDCHGRSCDDGMVTCGDCVDGLIWVTRDDPTGVNRHRRVYA